MDDLLSEYGGVVIILILGAGAIMGLTQLLTALWNGVMFI